MIVKVGISARHVHLTKETFKELFGNDDLTKLKDINQIGQYAANETVSIKGPKGQIDNVRIIGPLRKYNQVEISKTDSYLLGVNPPIRKSSHVEDAELITIIGPKKEITLNCCIIANRHIHMTVEEANALGIKDDDKAYVKIKGEKPGIIEAYYKVSEDAYKEIHLDLDDANAFLLKQDDEVEIIEKR